MTPENAAAAGHSTRCKRHKLANLEALPPAAQGSDSFSLLEHPIIISNEAWTAQQADSTADAGSTTAVLPQPAAADCSYHFTGWEAEDELSSHWGSDSCSSAGDRHDEAYQPLARWQNSTHVNTLFSGGSSSTASGSPAEAPSSCCRSFYIPGSSRAQLSGLQGLRRPCSAPAVGGHRQYTVRTQAIMEGSLEAAESAAEELQPGHQHDLQPLTSCSSWEGSAGLAGEFSSPEQPGACGPSARKLVQRAASPADGSGWQHAPYPRIAWQHAPYPAIFSSAVPDAATVCVHCNAPAVQHEEADEQTSLADEPSAPPLYDEPWADDADGTEAADVLLAASCGGPCAARRAVRFADSPASSASMCDGGTHNTVTTNGAAAGSWGATAFAAAAACQRSSTEGSNWSGWGGAAGSDHEAGLPSREVSEETRSYQRMLEVLAAKRRTAAAAIQSGATVVAAPGCPRKPAAALLALGRPGGSCTAAGPGCSGCDPGLRMTLLHPCPVPHSQAAAPAAVCQPSPPGRAGAAAADSPRWPGMQTYLGNLRKAAEPEPPIKLPGLSFWEQFAAEEARAECRLADDPAWEGTAEAAVTVSCGVPASCGKAAAASNCWLPQERPSCSACHHTSPGGSPAPRVQVEVQACAASPRSPASPGRKLVALLRGILLPSSPGSATPLTAFSPLEEAAQRLQAA